MITSEFRGEPPRSFTVSGHADYAPAGEDIVCAAVTSALRLAEIQINEILKVGAEIHIDPESNAIKLTLPEGDAGTATDILAGLRMYLEVLAKEYPSCIKVRRKRT